MSSVNMAAAFAATVARYERCGWGVCAMNHVDLRAIVRTERADPGALLDEETVRAPARIPACRKLWVDAGGLVQETDVPC